MNEYDDRMAYLEDRLAYMIRQTEDMVENIGEDQLTFAPVKNHGSAPLSLGLDPENRRLYVKMTDGTKFYITLILEES